MIEEKSIINIKENRFQELMDIYNKAMEKVISYLNGIKTDVKKFYNYDMIDHITYRIKSPESIISKMKKKGYDLNYKELIENVHDIAGVRVICALKSDIYKIRDIIYNIEDIKVIEDKDYITNQKKSGYMSYHLIIEVPIEYEGKIVYIKVEIQIRTMAMDFWATLEHKMKYKSQTKYSDECSKEFIKFAKTLKTIDNKIEKLYEKQYGKDNIVVLKRQLYYNKQT